MAAWLSATAWVVATFVVGASAGGYTCPPSTPGWPCLRDPDGSPMTLRVLWMDKAFVTSNPAAVAKAALLGRPYSCDDPNLAVPECFEFENWKGGWIGAFMHQTLKDMGVKVIALTRANFSSQVKKIYKGTSSFTKCVWDVRLGNVDLGVGDFWETPERRNLTAFTSAIDSDSFNLFTRYVPNPADEFTAQSLLTIFEPFSNSVWLCMAIMFCFCAISIWITEGQHNKEFEKGPLGLVKALYFSTMGFVGGDLPATVWPTRIVSLGFMIFIFIHVTSYTASLASTLVTNQVQIGEVSSLQDLIMKGKRLCVYQSMAAATSDIIGSVVQMVQMDNYGPMLEKLYQGNCSAAIVGRFESTTFIAASNVNFTVCTDPRDSNNFASCANSSIKPTTFNLNPATCGTNCFAAKRYCTFVNVDDPTVSLITLSFEMPVRKDLERWVSAAMMRLHMQGLSGTTETEELLDRNPPICTSPGKPSGSLTIEQMSGTYFFGGLFIVMGVLFHLVELLGVFGGGGGGGGGGVELQENGGRAVKRKVQEGRVRHSMLKLRERLASDEGANGGSLPGGGGGLKGDSDAGIEEQCLEAEAAVEGILHSLRQLGRGPAGGACAPAETPLAARMI